ncbi:MATE efflux family protein [Rhodocollybia butyracea]|uniref:MATE efflux family protein n=1 Tax=Rhodocollybia butyracea TaxID=206335 RepID=A0A9P5QA96_9AGAR|nr:MATE efflux family protein [Rhodocollybia butyracea]
MTPSSSEIDPLLPNTSCATLGQDVESDTGACTQEEGSNRQFGPIRSQLKLFFSLLVDSIPGKFTVILSYILQNSIQTISIVITGRLGPHELSVAAFSLMLAFVTGELRFPQCWCVALGGSTALDTLGSQAFTGSTRPTDLSVHFQRCVLLLWMLLVPVCVLWTFMHPILLALGQEEDLARDVQAFLRLLIIGAPGYIGFESLKKYLQCQGIMRASTIVLLFVSPVNIGLNIGLVHYTSLGLFGSAVALSIIYWLAFILLGVMTYVSPTHRRNGTWGGLQFRAVFQWRSCVTFFRLAIPGILMVGTEWAAFEIVALAAGRLGSLPLAAQSVIMTLDQILNTLPFGIGVAASTRVGNLLGLRLATDAKHAAHAAAFLSVIVGAMVMITLIGTRNVIGFLMSDDIDVVQLVSVVMPFVASFQIVDGLAGSCGGSLRGQGRQHLGALFNFIAYYILALPLGIFLAFHEDYGLKGLWIGQVVGLTIVGLCEYGAIWLGTDWDREVAKGVERNEEEAKRQAHTRAINDN